MGDRIPLTADAECAICKGTGCKQGPGSEVVWFGGQMFRSREPVSHICRCVQAGPADNRPRRCPQWHKCRNCSAVAAKCFSIDEDHDDIKYECAECGHSWISEGPDA